jgi:hypothetical protein
LTKLFSIWVVTPSFSTSQHFRCNNLDIFLTVNLYFGHRAWRPPWKLLSGVQIRCVFIAASQTRFHSCYFEFLDDSRFFTILVATIELAGIRFHSRCLIYGTHSSPCFTGFPNSYYMIIECTFDISVLNVWSWEIYWFWFSVNLCCLRIVFCITVIDTFGCIQVAAPIFFIWLLWRRLMRKIGFIILLLLEIYRA